MTALNMQLTAPKAGAVGLSALNAVRVLWLWVRLIAASTRRLWRWALASTVAALISWFIGHDSAMTTAWVAVGLVPATIRATCRYYWPRHWHRFVSVPWRRHLWRRTWRRQWRSLSELLKLGQVNVRISKDKETGKETRTETWCPVKAKVRTSDTGLDVMVATPRGGVDADVRAHAEAIATDMGAHAVEVRKLRKGWTRFILCMVPILETVRRRQQPSPLGVVIGRYETGQDVVLDVLGPHSTVLQGASRSGKSTLLYVILAALAGRSDVVVCGYDPSGIVLAPWEQVSRHRHWIARGTKDMRRAAAALESIVREMDERIEGLDAVCRDKLPAGSPDMPYIVVVLDEWPGAQLAAETADANDGMTGKDSYKASIRRSGLRLVQEGLKVNVICVMAGQRLSSKSIDTDQRSNFGPRATLRSDSSEAVGMLHSNEAAAQFADECLTWEPGVGIIQLPGQPAMRFRADLMDYDEYYAIVTRQIAADAVERPAVTVIPEETSAVPTPAPAAPTPAKQPAAKQPALVLTEIDDDDPATWPVVTEDELLSSRRAA